MKGTITNALIKAACEAGITALQEIKDAGQSGYSPPNSGRPKRPKKKRKKKARPKRKK